MPVDIFAITLGRWSIGYIEKLLNVTYMGHSTKFVQTAVPRQRNTFKSIQVFKS